MKNKLSIFAVTLIFSLTLLSCAYASDVNETVIADDQPFIESNVVYEEEIADESLISPDNEIIHEEETPVADIVIDNNDTTSFESVNNIEYGNEESDFDIENYETPIKVNCLNDSQFCDINPESDEKLDATFNNRDSIIPVFELNFLLDDIDCFEVFLLKMEDFESNSFKEGRFNNTFAVKQELSLYILHDNNFKIYLDCNIVICSNKMTDNFAYSINNSVTDDECSVVYCGFNSSYFTIQNYLFFNNNFYFCASIFSQYLLGKGCLIYKTQAIFNNDEIHVLKVVI